MHLLARKPLVFMAAAAAMFIGISPASAATASHSSSPASSHSASSAAAARAAILAAARAASPALAVMPRIGGFAGNDESRDRCAESYHGKAKPVWGSGTLDCHYAPRP